MADTDASLSIDEATDKILSMLGPDDDAPDAPPEPPQDLAGDDDDVVADEEDAAPETDAEIDPDAGDEAETPIAPPASWKADAKERFKALPRELQKVVADREREREVHFSKTQTEAAQARRAADAERQAVQHERQAYAQGLGSLIDMTCATDPVLIEAGRTDWNALFRQNPAAAQAKWNTFQERSRTLGAWMAQRDRVAARADAEGRGQSDRLLAERLEFWRDEGKRNAFKAAMNDYLTRAGFAPSELSGLSDARTILVARKAMLYDHLMAQQARIPAARKARAATRSVRAQASSDDGVTSMKAKVLMKRAARTGRLSDQVEAVLAML